MIFNFFFHKCRRPAYNNYVYTVLNINAHTNRELEHMSINIKRGPPNMPARSEKNTFCHIE